MVLENSSQLKKWLVLGFDVFILFFLWEGFIFFRVRWLGR